VTEEEWLACQDPTPMLALLRGRVSERRLRLFACACCRRIWDRLEQEGSRHAVEVAEDFADGRASLEQLKLARQILQKITDPSPRGGELACGYTTDVSAWDAATGAARSSQVVFSPAWDAACRRADRTHRRADQEVVDAVARGERKTASKEQAAILRCLFNSPFRSIAHEPAWMPDNAVTLTRTIYEERRFDLLPLLADLLEEAGCPAEVSEHCRGPGPHVRGCWVVDLVLGKE
jgi:hypothetical protein